MAPVQDIKDLCQKNTAAEYSFNPQIGFIFSLSHLSKPEEGLGLAFQYTYNGRDSRLVNFHRMVPRIPADTSQKVYSSVTKSTSQRTNLPRWDLRMKTVYSVWLGH